MIESIFTSMAISDDKMLGAIQKNVEVRSQINSINGKRQYQNDLEDFDDR